MGSLLSVLCHAILSVRDLSKKEKEAWKVLLDYSVFSEQMEECDHISEEARGFFRPSR